MKYFLTILFNLSICILFGQNNCLLNRSIQVKLDSISENDIILLGESSHGVDEFNNCKIEIVKYLIENHNLKSIFFESGVEDVWTACNNDSLSIALKLKYSIFPVWHTKEFLEFFTYLFERNIQIYGFDLQNSLFEKIEYYDLFFSDNYIIRKELSQMDTLIDDYNFKYSSEFLKNLSKKELNGRKKELKIEKDLLLAQLTNLSKYVNLLDEEEKFWYNIIIENRKDLVELQKPYYSSSYGRDSIMAYNIKLISSNIEIGKSVVWAHNSHIAKVISFGQFDMGFRLLEANPALKIHSMAFYASEGEQLLNDDKSEVFLKINNSFLETKLKKISDDNLNLFILKEENIHFFKRRLKSLYFGSVIEKIRPIKSYDSIFYIKKVNAMKRI